MDNLKQKIALTALNEMFAKGHFCICTINKVAELLDVNPKGKAYSMLSPLHCINFDKMPADVREAIPGLIQECLGGDPVFRFESLAPMVVDVPIKSGILGLLRGAQ